jgi:hypothetical protein
VLWLCDSPRRLVEKSRIVTKRYLAELVPSRRESFYMRIYTQPSSDRPAAPTSATPTIAIRWSAFRGRLPGPRQFSTRQDMRQDVNVRRAGPSLWRPSHEGCAGAGGRAATGGRAAAGQALPRARVGANDDACKPTAKEVPYAKNWPSLPSPTQQHGKRRLSSNSNRQHAGLIVPTMTPRAKPGSGARTPPQAPIAHAQPAPDRQRRARAQTPGSG